MEGSKWTPERHQLGVLADAQGFVVLGLDVCQIAEKSKPSVLVTPEGKWLNLGEVARFLDLSQEDRDSLAYLDPLP